MPQKMGKCVCNEGKPLSEQLDHQEGVLSQKVLGFLLCQQGRIDGQLGGNQRAKQWTTAFVKELDG